MAVFQFNGYDLNDYFKLIKVSHDVGNERDITTDSAPKIGVNVQQVSFGAKKIKLTVSLATRDLNDNAFVDPNEPAQIDIGMFHHVREQAARVLHTERPVELKLPDEPDRYYLAIVKGDVTLKGISDWYDQTEIEFLVPDGVAHSTTYRSFENPKIENNKMVFDLVNDGSVNANPIITVKHNSENGYIGLVNSTGICELGDRLEANTEDYRHSEVLFDYASSNGEHRIPNGLSQGLKNIGISNDVNDTKPNGSLYIDNAWGRPHIALQSGQVASVTFDIPRDSSGEKGALYEYFWWRQIFWLGSANQMGYLKICVTDASGTFLYGVETFKRYNGLDCEYNFLAGDGKGGFRIVDRKHFLGTHIEQHNPFNEPRGWSDIQRFDDV
ncbi:MAG: phage tail family protein, partial [Streptococcus thermophilus]|nr:phage tail family protein [Streptococcus thermophilus]